MKLILTKTFMNKHQRLFMIVFYVILISLVGCIMIKNFINIDLSEEFIPISIEIEIDNEMQYIDLHGITQQIIMNDLWFTPWERSKANYDLKIAAYLTGQDNSIIAMSANLDGHTLFKLISGFGLLNGRIYQAPTNTLDRIRSNLIQHQVPTDEAIVVKTAKADYIEISKMLYEKYITRYMSDEVYDRMEIISYKINSIEFFGGDLKKFVVVLNVDLVPKDIKGSYWYIGNGCTDSVRGLAIEQINENTYQLVDLATGGFSMWLKDE